MTLPSIKFNLQEQTEFIKVLRTRVNDYFQENNKTRFANGQMVFKTIFMLALYFVPLVLMLTGVVSGLWPVMGMWVLMAFGMSGIGLSIMHDANHGAYSSNPWVNKTLGYMINFLGGYHVNWRIQHNVLHHSYTNIEGHDEDITTPVLRFSPNQKHRKIYRFQTLYAPFFYGIMSLYWLLAKDVMGVIRYNQKDLLKSQGRNLFNTLTEVIFNKVWYILLIVVLPMILVDVAWWQTLLGFLMMHFISGLLLALIFQSAHVIEETDFFEAGETGSMENHWAVHQLKTTANFAQRSRLFSWFIGGLNFQIEHHLFPNICHIHYKRISKIVEETAKEFNLPYYSHRTFYSALKSHFTLLHQLGTGKYDRNLAGG